MVSVRGIVGDFEGAMAAGREALELAATLGDPALHVHVSYRLGQTYMRIGDYRRAAEVLRGNVEVLARSTPGYMRDRCIKSQAWLAEVLAMLGEFAEGRRHGEEALRLARGDGPWYGDVPIPVRARLGALYLAQGELEAAIRVFEEGMALARESGVRTVLNAGPDVLNHNIETVPRLYRMARSGGRYPRSLELLDRSRRYRPDIATKTGIMVGLGEEHDEIVTVFDDLRRVGVSILTIGQYLRPSPAHAPMTRYYHPDEFAALKRIALERGFVHVESGPLVRSSYHAHEQADAFRASQIS